MSDIRRWHLQGLPGTTGIVDVMLYADHLAAVASEYERGRVDECAQRTLVYGNLLAAERQQGVSDERARIRTAIIELVDEVGWRTIALETIDNEED